MTHPYTEDQLVEQPAIGLFVELCWKTLCAMEETLCAGSTMDQRLKSVAVRRSLFRHPTEAVSGGIQILRRTCNWLFPCLLLRQEEFIHDQELKPRRSQAIAAATMPRLRVMAGRETGKCFAMTRRIVRLIRVDGVDPERINVVTFTRTVAHGINWGATVYK